MGYFDIKQQKKDKGLIAFFCFFFQGRVGCVLFNHPFNHQLTFSEATIDAINVRIATTRPTMKV